MPASLGTYTYYIIFSCKAHVDRAVFRLNSIKSDETRILSNLDCSWAAVDPTFTCASDLHRKSSLSASPTGYWANIPIVYAVGTPSIPCEALVRQQLLWTLRDPVANAQPRIPKAWSTHDASTDRFPNSNTEELRHGFQGPLDPTYTKSSAPRLCIPMAISPIPNTLMMCSTSQSSDLCSRVYCRAVTQVITRTKLANLLDKETVWWVDLQVSLGCFLAWTRMSEPPRAGLRPKFQVLDNRTE
jgi:hypothetical protein